MAHLTDIDSLLLQVRDAESKKLIEEAVTAYRGGALRSAIVATWIAAVYDAIAKLRELKEQGDAEAASIVAAIDSASEEYTRAAVGKNEMGRRSALKRMAEFESDLFAKHFRSMELLSEHEIEIYEQLQKDRHKCAHPAFGIDNSLFQPSLEIVRAYIVHALSTMLIHAPLHGRSAIEKFEAQVFSDYFPNQLDVAHEFIKERFLKYAKDIFIISLTKKILSIPFLQDVPLSMSNVRRLIFSLSVIAKEKTAIFEREAKLYISHKYGNIYGENLLYILLYVRKMPEVWQWIPNETRKTAKTILQHVEFKMLIKFAVFETLDVVDLREALLKRFQILSHAEQSQVVKYSSNEHLVQSVLDIYRHAQNWSRAKEIGNDLILPLVDYFTISSIHTLFDVFKENHQVRYAFGTSEVYTAILKAHPEYDARPQYEALRAKADSLDSDERKLFDLLHEYYNNQEAIS